MTKWIIGIVVVVLVGGGLYYYMQMPASSPTPGDQQPTTPPPAQEPSGTGDGTMTGQVQDVSLTAKNFEFSTKEIRVKKGTRVKINLSSTQGFHDWVVDEFNAATGRVNTGGATSVEFVADKTGTFEYYCSVGTHRQMGMVDKLIVE